MLLKEFLRRVQEREANYNHIDDTWYCKRCGAVIQAIRKPVPLHEGYSLFGNKHAGSGKCQWIQIPYCPNCEEPFEVDCIDL